MSTFMAGQRQGQAQVVLLSLDHFMSFVIGPYRTIWLFLDTYKENWDIVSDTDALNRIDVLLTRQKEKGWALSQ